MKHNSLTLYKLMLLVAVLLSPALAQSQDLQGDWMIENTEGRVYRMEFQPQGNGWSATAREREAVNLKLNPAGLKNQWVGTLNFDAKHEVKAELKEGRKLLLTDLKSGETWALFRAP